MDRSVHATKKICIFISKRQQAPTLIGDFWGHFLTLFFLHHLDF